MLKFIKYEAKTVYREYLLVLLIGLLLNIALMTRVGTWEGILIFGLSTAVGGGIMLVTMIMNIAMFSRDLKKDTKYLVFTLPESRSALLGSKLICSVIMMIIGAFVGLAFMLYFGDKIVHINFNELFNWNVFAYFIWAIFIYISFLITIYFCILVGRTLRKNGKFSGLLSLIIFVVYTYILAKVETGLEYLFPQKFVLEKIARSFGDTHVKASVSTAGGSIYIASMVLELLLIIILFMISVKILDEKIDL
ncbi:ABC-2 transporter permease [Clostridium felsineum]|uniref:Uncharacterized protein n=1 Tax=Clostridium felsineum TaxID=36839 RepID=A0A1S8LCA8_9CLOT|nr:ABC-2 transporter permease [Clostridium felsineum]URZ04804.1 hypothetical protein CLROS_001190 [Clostridium felsineum]URZ09845.1 hypothetical protein CROST_005440 [Clostridium felsineum]